MSATPELKPTSELRKEQQQHAVRVLATQYLALFELPETKDDTDNPKYLRDVIQSLIAINTSSKTETLDLQALDPKLSDYALPEVIRSLIMLSEENQNPRISDIKLSLIGWLSSHLSLLRQLSNHKDQVSQNQATPVQKEERPYPGRWIKVEAASPFTDEAGRMLPTEIQVWVTPKHLADSTGTSRNTIANVKKTVIWENGHGPVKAVLSLPIPINTPEDYAVQVVAINQQTGTRQVLEVDQFVLTKNE